ncbi:MAG: radical SAM protein, partial [Spirochaetales bacterium]|nr:radical SAM protein [Spirochaetales bacterium]
PQDVVNAAVQRQCKSISFTSTEPTTLLEFVLDTAQLSSQQNLHNIMVSNGYMSDQCIDALNPAIEAINIDLKSFSDSFYKKICHARLDPILNTIRRLHGAGVHVEITTLILPELNDTETEFTKISAFIRSVHPEIPWHISRFQPSYKLQHLPITPSHTLLNARDVGKKMPATYLYWQCP